MISEGPSWTYTTVVNIVFLGIAVVLVAHCLRTGDPAMLHLMNTPEDEMTQQDQAEDMRTSRPSCTRWKRGVWSASPWSSPCPCGACRRIAQRSWTISLVEGQGAMKGGRL
jgi:hypothetical protein